MLMQVDDDNKYSGIKDIYGNDVLTYEALDEMRRRDRERPIKNFICPNAGGQERALSSNAKIRIFGSSRGPGKSFAGLLECIYDIEDPNFTAIALRAEKPDLDSLIECSRGIFKDFGYFVSSDKSLCWRLNSGGTIYFSYHSGNIEDFKQRFQGKERCYVFVDESTHVDEFAKILYLTTIMRNTTGIRLRMMLTCNPDNKSYLRKLCDWWIGKKDTIYSDGLMHPERAGLPIPERDGMRRYVFFAGGDSLNDAVWGDTAEEVYNKAKAKIDSLWKPEYEAYGNPQDLFIHSIEFFGAKLSENIKLMQSDPSYLANLANQSDEMIARDLEGNWDYEQFNEDYISTSEMEDFFSRPPDYGDGVLRMSQDLAFEGGDLSISWLIRGNCIIDIDVSQLNSRDSINHTNDLKRNWGVDDRNHVYDSNGLGQSYKGFFPKAVPFNNQESPYGATANDLEIAKKDFDSLKSQCAYNLADAIKYGEITISRHLLERRFSGKGFENMTLREILMQERRFFNVDETKRDRGKGRCLSSKPEIKKWLHRSPDFTEALVYSRVFWVKKQQTRRMIPRGHARYVNYRPYR